MLGKDQDEATIDSGQELTLDTLDIPTMLQGIHPLPISRIDLGLGLQTPYIENGDHTSEFFCGSSRSSTPMPSSILHDATEQNQHFHDQNLHSASNCLTQATTPFKNHSGTSYIKAALGSIPRNEPSHDIHTQEHNPDPLMDAARGAICCRCQDVFTLFNPGTSRGNCKRCNHQFCRDCNYM